MQRLVSGRTVQYKSVLFFLANLLTCLRRTPPSSGLPLCLPPPFVIPLEGCQTPPLPCTVPLSRHIPRVEPALYPGRTSSWPPPPPRRILSAILWPWTPMTAMAAIHLCLCWPSSRPCVDLSHSAQCLSRQSPPLLARYTDPLHWWAMCCCRSILSARLPVEIQQQRCRRLWQPVGG